MSRDPGSRTGWTAIFDGRYDEARQSYATAIEHDPRCAEAAYNLGSLDEDCGDVEAAVRHYRRALQVSPDYADAHFNLAAARGNEAALGGTLPYMAPEQLAHFATPEGAAAGQAAPRIDAYVALGRTLLALNEDQQLTVLLAEQNIDNALAVADRGYVLEVGEIAISDTAAGLMERGDVEDKERQRLGVRGRAAW